jgi:hypothetical protein
MIRPEDLPLPIPAAFAKFAKFAKFAGFKAFV